MDDSVTLKKIEFEKAILMTKVFAWLAFSLYTSGFSAISFLKNYDWTNVLSNNPISIIIILVVELGIVIWLSLNIKTFSTLQTGTFLLLYSIINGITIPIIFQYITGDLQVNIFFILATMFLIMSALSYITKQDFASLGGLTFMAMIGLGLDFAVNMLWRTNNRQLIMGGIGVVIFVGLVAYYYHTDNNANEHEDAMSKAFSIYINLFYLFILIIMEANKSNRKNTID